jgi:hypothetical protein
MAPDDPAESFARHGGEFLSDAGVVISIFFGSVSSRPPRRVHAGLGRLVRISSLQSLGSREASADSVRSPTTDLPSLGGRKPGVSVARRTRVRRRGLLKRDDLMRSSGNSPRVCSADPPQQCAIWPLDVRLRAELQTHPRRRALSARTCRAPLRAYAAVPTPPSLSSGGSGEPWGNFRPNPA